jgi:hypothetical protein
MMFRFPRLPVALSLLAAITTQGAIAQPAQPPQSTPQPPAVMAAPATGGPRFPQRFAAANTTHDGRLTLAQAEAAHLRPIVRNFSSIDTTGQGYVTLAQIQAWRQARRAQRSAPPTDGG